MLAVGDAEGDAEGDATDGGRTAGGELTEKHGSRGRCRAVLAWATNKAPAEMRSVHELQVGGHARGLVLHAAASPAAPAPGRPLLLILHGSTEDRSNGSVHFPAERFERNYHAVFAGHGFVLAYLSARLANGWYCWENGNGKVGLCARAPDENDQQFTRAAVELVGREVGPVNRARVHVLGMSGGASMAWKLGCDPRSREITGLAPRVAAVAGTLAPGLCTCCCASPVVVAVREHACASICMHIHACVRACVPACLCAWVCIHVCARV